MILKKYHVKGKSTFCRAILLLLNWTILVICSVDLPAEYDTSLKPVKLFFISEDEKLVSRELSSLKANVYDKFGVPDVYESSSLMKGREKED